MSDLEIKKDEDNLANLVYELNVEMYEKFGDNEGLFFSYKTHGFIDFIMFDEHVLWSNDVEDRDYNEETDEYEPLLPFLKSQFNKYADLLYSMKFNEV